MNHYTYYSFEQWGRGYIGRRSCKCSPEEDNYFGSYRERIHTSKVRSRVCSESNRKRKGESRKKVQNK